MSTDEHVPYPDIARLIEKLCAFRGATLEDVARGASLKRAGQVLNAMQGKSFLHKETFEKVVAFLGMTGSFIRKDGMATISVDGFGTVQVPFPDIRRQRREKTHALMEDAAAQLTVQFCSQPVQLRDPYEEAMLACEKNSLIIVSRNVVRTLSRDELLFASTRHAIANGYRRWFFLPASTYSEWHAWASLFAPSQQQDLLRAYFVPEYLIALLWGTVIRDARGDIRCRVQDDLDVLYASNPALITEAGVRQQVYLLMTEVIPKIDSAALSGKRVIWEGCFRYLPAFLLEEHRRVATERLRMHIQSAPEHD